MVGWTSLEAKADNVDIGGPACTGRSLVVTATVEEFRDVQLRGRGIRVMSVFCEALVVEHQDGLERRRRVRKRTLDADIGRRP